MTTAPVPSGPGSYRQRGGRPCCLERPWHDATGALRAHLAHLGVRDPAGPDRIRVTWTGGEQARSVKVLAGADGMTDAHHCSTGWLPAAVRSAVLTAPSRLRKVLGGGTGDVVFVEVAMTDSLHPARADPVR